jgi:hypothetical protein
MYVYIPADGRVRAGEPREHVGQALRDRLLGGVDLVLELVGELGLDGDGLEVADDDDGDHHADELGDVLGEVVRDLDGRQARGHRAHDGDAFGAEVEAGGYARVHHHEAEGPGQQRQLLSPARAHRYLAQTHAARAPRYLAQTHAARA